MDEIVEAVIKLWATSRKVMPCVYSDSKGMIKVRNWGKASRIGEWENITYHRGSGNAYKSLIIIIKHYKIIKAWAGSFNACNALNLARPVIICLLTL